MKTQITLGVRLSALAVAGLALTGIASTPVHAADLRPVTPLNGGSGTLGPGLGSVKSPFLVIESGTPLGRKSDDRAYFHTSTGTSVQEVPVSRLGPGPWSIKSPFNRIYANGSY